MAKHTGGVWVRDSRDWIVATNGISGVVVARLNRQSMEHMERAEINANARLIESGPAMFALLEEAFASGGNAAPSGDWYERCRDTLARIRGDK